MKTPLLFIFLLSFTIISYAQKITKEQIDEKIESGYYDDAKNMIDLYIAQNNLSASQIYGFNSQKDILNRIKIDFSKSRKDIIEYIKKYYPNVNDSMLTAWEEEKSLESKIINGEKKYFNRAAPNFFRINKEAQKTRLKVDGPYKDNVKDVLRVHIPEVTKYMKEKSVTQSAPVNMKVRYTITLKPNTIPDGEMVRCWLPYPTENNRRQSVYFG